MLKYILLSFILISSQALAQEDSISFNKSQSFGFGLANTIQSGSILIQDAGSWTYTTRYSFDYRKQLFGEQFLRTGFTSAIKRNVSGNQKLLEFNEMIVNLGFEDSKALGNERFQLFYGADLLYQMTLVRAKISAVFWQSSLFGFGIGGSGGLRYSIGPNSSLSTELNLGIGLEQEFQNNSNSQSSAQEVWVFGFFMPRALSLSWNYHF